MHNPKLIAWLFEAAMQWADPSVPTENVQAIVQAAADVAFRLEEAPLFEGEDGRARTAIVLLSIASYESSGFLQEIRSGKKRGDGGQSWCLMQVHLPGSTRVVMRGQYYGYSYARGEGWAGKDLAADDHTCFTAGLHIARESLRVCRNLSVYTSGKCLKNEPKAKERLARGTDYAKKVSSPVPDVAFWLPPKFSGIAPNFW